MLVKENKRVVASPYWISSVWSLLTATQVSNFSAKRFISRALWRLSRQKYLFGLRVFCYETLDICVQSTEKNAWWCINIYYDMTSISPTMSRLSSVKKCNFIAMRFVCCEIAPCRLPLSVDFRMEDKDKGVSLMQYRARSRAPILYLSIPVELFTRELRDEHLLESRATDFRRRALTL